MTDTIDWHGESRGLWLSTVGTPGCGVEPEIAYVLLLILGAYLHHRDKELWAAGSTGEYGDSIEYSHITLAWGLVEQSIDTIANTKANTFILYYPR